MLRSAETIPGEISGDSAFASLQPCSRVSRFMEVSPSQPVLKVKDPAPVLETPAPEKVAEAIPPLPDDEGHLEQQDEKDIKLFPAHHNSRCFKGREASCNLDP